MSEHSETAPEVAAAVTLTGSLVSRCLEAAQSSDAAALRNLVGDCLEQHASLSRDLKPRTADFKLDLLFARADRRWEELREIGAASGTWSQAQCAPLVEGCIEDLTRLAAAMNGLNELVWDGQMSADGALDACTGLTGAAGQQLILVATIALKVAKDTGVSLSSSATHARYDFDTICNIGTACIRAYVDRAFPEPAVIATRPGHCRVECQDPAGERYFTSEEVPSGAPKAPAFAAAVSAANAARRKKVTSETDARVAGAGLTSMWASARSLYERRGPHRAEPRSP